MESEMVERVARAIAASLDGDMPRFVRQPWDAMTDLAKEAMLRRARAAIEAMREPTEAMMRGGGYDPTGLARNTRLAHWDTMIDAALSPKQEG